MTANPACFRSNTSYFRLWRPVKRVISPGRARYWRRDTRFRREKPPVDPDGETAHLPKLHAASFLRTKSDNISPSGVWYQSGLLLWGVATTTSSPAPEDVQHACVILTRKLKTTPSLRLERQTTGVIRNRENSSKCTSLNHPSCSHFK